MTAVAVILGLVFLIVLWRVKRRRRERYERTFTVAAPNGRFAGYGRKETL